MGKIAFLFAGQGAQYPGMGEALYETSAAAKAVFDMGERLRPGTLSQCFHGEKEELQKTENTQPCLFLTDLACAAALKERGIQADAAAGFSLGELPALAFAGVLGAEDAFRAVCLRGQAMGECAEKNRGGMAAVLRLPAETVEEICARFERIFPVNYNCPGQIACAGAEDELEAFCGAIRDAGGKTVRLAVSGAFHTPFMKEAETRLRAFLAGTETHAPEIAVYANTTAEKYPADHDAIVSLLSGQLARSVRWESILRRMAEEGVDTFIEVGAGKTLSGLTAKTLQNVTVLQVGDDRTLETTVAALAGAGGNA